MASKRRSEGQVEFPLTPQPVPLSVWIEGAANTVLLEIRGELSARTSSLLERHLDLLATCDPQTVVIDLTALTDLDGVGARVLMGIGQYIRGGGGTFRVAGAIDTVSRLLDEAAQAMEPIPHPGPLRLEQPFPMTGTVPAAG